MKRILLITTGGTIAAADSTRGLTPQSAGAEMLQMLPGLASLCQIETSDFTRLDSSNIQPEEWLQMAQTVYTALESFDGVVISHGTDTMAYSASALSFMLRNLDKPVIFTGSQQPLTAPGSDGPANLYNAFATAVYGQPGVYVVFAGKIIHGCRAVKVCAQSAEAFFSVNAPLAGTVENGRPTWLAPAAQASAPRYLSAYCQSRVLLLKLAPGLDPDIVEAAIILGYRGLVVEGYGAGNVTTERRNLAAALAKAIRSGLSVAVTSQCLLEASDMTIYEPGLVMRDAGAMPSADMTTEALYTKLCWALGQTSDQAQIRAIMTQNVAGEMSD